MIDIQLVKAILKVTLSCSVGGLLEVTIFVDKGALDRLLFRYVLVE